MGVSNISKSYWSPALIAIIIPLLFVSLTSDIVAADNEIQVLRGSTITIQATILQNGSYGDPVQNQRIYYFDQTFNTFLGSSISDQNGIASLDWEIPIDHLLGFTVLNATFYGNESLSLSPSFQRISVLVQSHTFIEVDQISAKLTPGDLLSFNVHLVDDSNFSISNEILEVTLDESHLAFITTNSSGMADFSTQIDERFSLGIHSLKIHYNGSHSYYSQSSLDKTIEINSPISISVQVSENAIIGLNLRVEATITDLLNRPLSNSILSVLDVTSGQSFSVPIDNETTIDFQYLLQGPLGTHILVIEILENPFISNNQDTVNFTAWSKSEIVLVNSGVDQYASPNQEVTLEVRLIDWNGNSSLKQLHLFINSEAYASETTNDEGLTTFTFLAPTIETEYNISIVYTGNISRFELPTKYDYNLVVTTLMPIEIELDSYEVIAPLHQISVQLIVRGLNKSLLNGVRVNFNWLSFNSTTESFDEGLIMLQLTIPSASGRYFLYYESEPTRFVESTTGSILIEITSSDIMSTEGVGITGMIIALCASIGLVAVPVIRRRYLIG
ncbi:MAG: hypothetical protein RTV41_01930 [Candidatus Thorarchaeota archaeon]